MPNKWEVKPGFVVFDEVGYAIGVVWEPPANPPIWRGKVFNTGRSYLLDSKEDAISWVVKNGK